MGIRIDRGSLSELTIAVVVLASGLSVQQAVLAGEVQTPAPSRWDTWEQVDSLNERLPGRAEVSLGDGRVLLTGGYSSEASSSSAAVEMFDRETKQWTTMAAMGMPRNGHGATLLSDGRVFVAGGFTASSEIYDPALNEWSPVAEDMSVARAGGPVVVSLNDNRVLVAGGSEPSGNDWVPTTTAEIFDLDTGQWSAAKSMPFPFLSGGNRGKLLDDGRVMMMVGENRDEPAPPLLYTPDEGQGEWEAVSSPPQSLGQLAESITLGPGPRAVYRSASGDRLLIYDASTSSWDRSAQSPINLDDATGAPLSKNRLLLLGDSAGIYEIATETFSGVQDPGSFSAYLGLPTPLDDGSVLVRSSSNTETALYVPVLPGTTTCSIRGTEGSDVLEGTSGRDIICGRGGNDRIRPGGGGDVVVGGAGRDRIDYRTSPNPIDLDMQAGKATGLGLDHLFQVEDAYGSAFADSLVGSTARDWLAGFDGDDVVIGGAGDDTLIGGGGNDVVRPGNGADDVVGGDQADSVSFSNATQRVRVNLRSGIAYGQGEDILVQIEKVIGSPHDDFIVGSDERNVLKGGDGEDTLEGQDGPDDLFGGDDHDAVLGGAGSDDLSGNAGLDYGNGGSGTDKCTSIERGPGC